MLCTYYVLICIGYYNVSIINYNDYTDVMTVILEKYFIYNECIVFIEGNITKCSNNFMVF